MLQQPDIERGVEFPHYIVDLQVITNLIAAHGAWSSVLANILQDMEMR